MGLISRQTAVDCIVETIINKIPNVVQDFSKYRIEHVIYALTPELPQTAEYLTNHFGMFCFKTSKFLKVMDNLVDLILPHDWVNFSDNYEQLCKKLLQKKQKRLDNEEKRAKEFKVTEVEVSNNLAVGRKNPPPVPSKLDFLVLRKSTRGWNFTVTMLPADKNDNVFHNYNVVKSNIGTFL